VTTAPLAIVGPTASGKSALADALARRLGGEIVSADSMQVYRGMDIGTAKTPAEERAVPYHCLDLVEPGEPYSAAVYQRDARQAIEDIVGRGLAAVMVGGTGLYVRAALDEFSFPAGAIDDDLRRSLEQRATAEGPEALHAELRALDPEAAARIHPNNVRRTVRALEMLAGGKRYSEQAEGFGRRRDHYPGTRYLGLTMERETLYRRVDERVDTMLSAGLLQEVRRLADAGYRQALTSMQAIGYKELLPVLDAELPLHEAVSQIKQATRRYAKRQLSWFRADPRIVWLDVTALSPSETLERAWRLVESSEHS
jgi:tRNA dimethylallyltransferase